MPIKLGSVDVGISNPPSDDATYGRKNGAWVDLASSAALQFRQGTEADRQNLLTPPASGEPIYVTDTNRLFIGDGVTLGGRGLVADSDSYVVCQPGDNIQAKYEQAKLLTPGGNALSATNRAALIVFPGSYSVEELGVDYSAVNYPACLDIDTNFVDVIGLGGSERIAAVRLVPVVSVSAGFRVTATDVHVSGLECTYSSLGTALGGKQRISRCGGILVLTMDVGGYSDAIVTGCYNTAVVTSAAVVAAFGQDGAGFSGVIEGCNMTGVGKYVSLTGAVVRCEHQSTNFYMMGSINQARASFGYAPRWNSFPGRGGFSEGALDSISVGSPAVFTRSYGGVRNWCRLQFTTTGSLPTGLSTGTTYYAKNADYNAGTFEVATSIGGASVATTGAGSGTHSIVNPSGKDGGWFSYYSLKNTDGSSI